MRIEIPPLHLTTPKTSGLLSDIVANQQLRQKEYDSWQLSITSQYEVAEGCRPSTIFDAMLGRIDDPSLVLMNKGKKVKLVRVEGAKQHKTEGWCFVVCEFNRRNKKNIDRVMKDGFPSRPTREEALEEYEATKKVWEAKYHNNLIYNPVEFIWSR